MSNFVIHKASSRGHANHGWLDAHHSFSFANYYDPERIHFGALRVLNDDTVDAGMGFGMHPHDNMEIITIPLEGAIEHKDSMGNSAVIQTGDVQVMSAGTGILHSEFNHHKDQFLKLLQIWVIPNKRSVTPRYQQISLKELDIKNQLNQIISPFENEAGIWIHQDAWFHIGTFDNNTAFEYVLKKQENGVYIFIIEGQFSIQDEMLSNRDAIGIWNSNKIDLKSQSENARILIIEVPMIK